MTDKIEIPTFENMVYDPDRHLSDIDLPDGWAWEDPTIIPTVGNSGYTAIYTPKDTNNYDYSAQNLKPKLTINVEKAEPKYVVPSDLTVGWGSNLSDVVLPKGFSWKEAGSVGEIGTHTFKVTYTPEDTNNYNSVYDIEVAVKVVKAEPQVTPPNDIITDKESDNLTLSDLQLPEGWTWVEPDTKVEESGKYQAIYIPEDTEHYTSVIADVYVNLIKAEVSEQQETEEIENTDPQKPYTYDNISKYIILLCVSLTGIVCILFIKKVSKKH